MDKKFTLCTLQQIYAFVLAEEDVNKRDSRLNAVRFFSELNLGKKSSFRYEWPYKVSGQFGNVVVIDLEGAPDFFSKDLFVNWAYDNLN